MRTLQRWLYPRPRDETNLLLIGVRVTVAHDEPGHRARPVMYEGQAMFPPVLTAEGG